MIFRFFSKEVRSVLLFGNKFVRTTAKYAKFAKTFLANQEIGVPGRAYFLIGTVDAALSVPQCFDFSAFRLNPCKAEQELLDVDWAPVEKGRQVPAPVEG